MSDYPCVTEYVEQMKQKFIQDFAPISSDIENFGGTISVEDHFLLLKTKIDDFINAPSENEESILDEILHITVLMPIYPSEYFDYFTRIDFLQKAISRVMNSSQVIQEKSLHSLVQFLLPQNMMKCFNLINNILHLFKGARPEALIRALDFWDHLHQLPSKFARAEAGGNRKIKSKDICNDINSICQTLRMYRDTRKKTKYIIPIPSFCFFKVISIVSDILCRIDSDNSLSLLTLLAIEPIFVLPMIEKLPHPILLQSLPPLSMVYQISQPLSHSFVSMFRPMIMPIFELFGLFSTKANADRIKIIEKIEKNKQTDHKRFDFNYPIYENYNNNENYDIENYENYENYGNSENHVKSGKDQKIDIFNFSNVFDSSPFKNQSEQICHNFLRTIEIGPVGRDAFTLCLLSLFRNESQKYIADTIVRYVSDTTINTKEHDLISAGFIFAFDCMPFPSTSVLLNLDSKIVEPLMKAIQNMKEEYEGSPFGQKINHIYQSINGNNLNVSLLQTAYSMVHKINKEKRANDEVMSVLLSLSNRIYDPDYFIAFCGLTSSFFKEIVLSPKNNVRNSAFHLTIKFVGLIMGAPSTDSAPTWHYLNLMQDIAFNSLCKVFHLDELLFFFLREESISPSILLGSSILMSKLIINIVKESPDHFRKLACVDSSLLTSLMFKMSLSELPLLFRTMLRITETPINLDSSNFITMITKLVERFDGFDYRTSLRYLIAVLNNRSVISYLIFAQEAVSKIVSIVSTLIEQTPSIAGMKAVVWIWRQLGPSSLQCTTPLILQSFRANPTEYFFFSLVPIISNCSSPQKSVQALEMPSWEDSQLFAKFVNSLPKKFVFLKKGIVEEKECFPSGKDVSYPPDACLDELTGRFYTCPFM